MYPIFVTNNETKEPIPSMPGQFRWGVKQLDELIAPLVDKGLKSVLLFGVLSDSALKDGEGSYSAKASNPVRLALNHLRTKYPQLLLATDVCLCAYTHHGHCGVLHSNGLIDNARSIARLAEMARAFADSGAHVIAPSDMMDGRVGAIKHALQQGGHDGTVAVMSYAAKFASVFYGPFRDAASSGAQFGDRTKYQLPPMSRSLATRAMQRDLAEGADMIMVKPGGPYLDIVRDAKNLNSNVPIAIYHVSGEYAMLWHAAQAGAFELQTAVMETLGGFKRAGANILITYYTPSVLSWLKQQPPSSPATNPKQPTPASSTASFWKS